MPFTLLQLFHEIVLLVLGLAGGGFGLAVSNADVATYNSNCTGFFPPSNCDSIAAEASTFGFIALLGGVLFVIGLILTIIGAVLKPEQPGPPQVVVQPVYSPIPPPPYAQQAYAPPQPQSTASSTLRPKEMFCTACGSCYPAGTQFCSKDATALKETA